eukprot:Sdes_comp19886_c0_seq1m12213
MAERFHLLISHSIILLVWIPLQLATKTSIGFIGIGNMGSHMAKNLIKRGHQLYVMDKNPDAVGSLQKLGAVGVQKISDMTKHVKVLITMLPSSPHVKEVYLGKEGILATVQPNSLLIDSSTIDPSSSRQVFHQATARNTTFVDAPVSGGVGGAEAATLTFMVGGTQDAFTLASPYLQCMGKNIVHCGAVGNGQVAKICNNMVLGISMIAVAEGMNLGTKLGMDPKLLASIFNSSSARCWSSDTYNPVPGVIPSVPCNRDYEGGFGTALIAKDLGLAAAAATEEKIPIPFGTMAQQLYTLLCSKGLDKKDFGIVYKYL